MFRRGLFSLAVGSLLIVPIDAAAVSPPGPGAAACKTRCVWDQPHFNGNMVELTDATCKDFPVKSAANNSQDPGDKAAVFFFKQPGCQGTPENPYGLKAKTQSPRVEAASAEVKPATR